jgi:hypothetical protein
MLGRDIAWQLSTFIVALLVDVFVGIQPLCLGKEMMLFTIVESFSPADGDK